MLERTSYLPGVPCWLDTMQPDPEAAKEFYGGLFGWRFDNRAPAGSPGPYYVAQLHGYDVAAIGGPDASGATPFWNTYTAVENVDQTAARVRDAGGRVVAEPSEVPDAGRMAVFADAAGRGVLGVGSRHVHRRAAGQRARHLELQRAQHARTRCRRSLLRRGVRLGAPRARHGRLRVHVLHARGLRRLPCEEQSRLLREPGGRRGIGGIRRRGRVAHHATQPALPPRFRTGA